MSAILIMLGVFIASVLLTAFALWLAGKWMALKAATFRRTLLIIFLFFLFNLLVSAPLMLIPKSFQMAYSLVALVVEVLFLSYLIARSLRTTIGRAWAAVGILYVTQFVFLVVIFFVVQPFLIEAYAVPTMAMAPTIRGPHYVAKCPHCGGELLVDIPNPRLGFTQPTQPAICASCGQTFDIATASLAGPVISGDQIFVTKFLAPKRWDIIAFRAGNGAILVKRLVALPGETVAIDNDGHILINGAPIGSPPDRPALTFPWPDKFPLPNGSALTPATSLHLGPDDYFALGDNARSSYDSRFLGPIKKSDIVGVTTLIYWPLNRIKIIR